MALVTNTIGPTNGTYPTITLWEAASPSLGADIWHGQIVDAVDYDEEVTFAVAGTPSATSYLWLDVAGGVRHDGASGGAGARVRNTSDLSGNALLNVTTNWTRISNLELALGPTAGASKECIRVGAAGGSTGDVLVEKCLLSSEGSQVDQDGIYFADGDHDATVVDCSITSFNRGGIHFQNYTGAHRTGTVNVEHCSFHDSGTDADGAQMLSEADGSNTIVTWNIHNSAATNTAVGNSPINTNVTPAGTVTWNGSFNLLESSPGAGGTNNLTSTVTMTNGITDTTKSSGAWWVVTDAAAVPYDLRLLDSAAGNAAIDAGTDRQGLEPDARADFSTDAKGDTRPTTNVDIGAFELAPTGPTFSGPASQTLQPVSQSAAGTLAENTPPSPPTIVTPTEGSTIPSPVSLEITYSDPDGDPQARVSLRAKTNAAPDPTFSGPIDQTLLAVAQSATGGQPSAQNPLGYTQDPFNQLLADEVTTVAVDPVNYPFDCVWVRSPNDVGLVGAGVTEPELSQVGGGTLSTDLMGDYGTAADTFITAANAQSQLQGAINAAADGDIIEIGPGTTGEITLTGSNGGKTVTVRAQTPCDWRQCWQDISNGIVNDVATYSSTIIDFNIGTSGNRNLKIVGFGWNGGFSPRSGLYEVAKSVFPVGTGSAPRTRVDMYGCVNAFPVAVDTGDTLQIASAGDPVRTVTVQDCLLGHRWRNPGASGHCDNIQILNGVTVDLTRVGLLSVANRAQISSLGSGSVWTDVYCESNAQYVRDAKQAEGLLVSSETGNDIALMFDNLPPQTFNGAYIVGLNDYRGGLPSTETNVDDGQPYVGIPSSPEDLAFMTSGTTFGGSVTISATVQPGSPTGSGTQGDPYVYTKTYFNAEVTLDGAAGEFWVEFDRCWFEGGATFAMQGSGASTVHVNAYDTKIGGDTYTGALIDNVKDLTLSRCLLVSGGDALQVSDNSTVLIEDCYIAGQVNDSVLVDAIQLDLGAIATITVRRSYFQGQSVHLAGSTGSGTDYGRSFLTAEPNDDGPIEILVEDSFLQSKVYGLDREGNSNVNSFYRTNRNVWEPTMDNSAANWDTSGAAPFNDGLSSQSGGPDNTERTSTDDRLLGGGVI